MLCRTTPHTQPLTPESDYDACRGYCGLGVSARIYTGPRARAVGCQTSVSSLARIVGVCRRVVVVASRRARLVVGHHRFVVASCWLLLALGARPRVAHLRRLASVRSGLAPCFGRPMRSMRRRCLSVGVSPPCLGKRRMIGGGRCGHDIRQAAPFQARRSSADTSPAHDV